MFYTNAWIEVYEKSVFEFTTVNTKTKSTIDLRDEDIYLATLRNTPMITYFLVELLLLLLTLSLTYRLLGAVSIRSI